MQKQKNPTTLYLPLYLITALVGFFLPAINSLAEEKIDPTNYGAQQIANYTIEFFSAFPAEIDIVQENNDGSTRQLVQHQPLRLQGENFYTFYLDVAENQIEDQAKLIYTLNPLDPNNQRDLALEPLEPRIFFYQVGMLPSPSFNDQQQLWYPNPENRIDDYHIKRPNGDSIKGDDVTIASNDLTTKNGGLVVQFHKANGYTESGIAPLYYHLGQLELNNYGGLDINWHYGGSAGNSDHSFGKNVNKVNVSVNNNGIIAVAYSTSGTIYIEFGTQDPDDPTKINFKSPLDISSEFGSNNIGKLGLSISINDFNDFMLVASSENRESSYIVGHYDLVNHRVIWGKKNNGYEGYGYYNRYSGTLMTSLTNTGQVLETHTPEFGDNVLYFNYGQLNAGQKRITWEIITPRYDTGSRPAIALNEKLQLIEFHRGTSDRNIWFTLGDIQAQRLEGSKLNLNAAARLSGPRGTDRQMDVTLNNQGNFCYIRTNGGGNHDAYLNYRCGHFPESKILKIGTSGITDATFSGGYTRSRITDFDKSSLHEIEFIPQVSGRFTVNNVNNPKDTRRVFYVQAGRTYNPWVQTDEAGVIDVRFYPDSGLTTRDGSDYMSQIVVYDRANTTRQRRSFFPYEWQIDEAAGEGAVKIDLVGLPPNTTCKVSMPIISNSFTTITLNGINGMHKTVDTSDNIDFPFIHIWEVITDPAGNGSSLGASVDDQGLEHNLGEMKVLSCVNN